MDTINISNIAASFLKKRETFNVSDCCVKFVDDEIYPTNKNILSQLEIFRNILQDNPDLPKKDGKDIVFIVDEWQKYINVTSFSFFYERLRTMYLPYLKIQKKMDYYMDQLDYIMLIDYFTNPGERKDLLQGIDWDKLFWIGLISKNFMYLDTFFDTVTLSRGYTQCLAFFSTCENKLTRQIINELCIYFLRSKTTLKCGVPTVSLDLGCILQGDVIPLGQGGTFDDSDSEEMPGLEETEKMQNIDECYENSPKQKKIGYIEHFLSEILSSMANSENDASINSSTIANMILEKTSIVNQNAETYDSCIKFANEEFFMVNRYVLSHLEFFKKKIVDTNCFPKKEGTDIILEINYVDINTFHFFYERHKKRCIYSKINKKIILNDYLEQTKYITLLNILLHPEEMNIIFLDDIQWYDMFWISSLSQGIPVNRIFNGTMCRDAFNICIQFLNSKGELTDEMKKELRSYFGVAPLPYSMSSLKFGETFNVW